MENLDNQDRRAETEKNNHRMAEKDIKRDSHRDTRKIETGNERQTDRHR